MQADDLLKMTNPDTHVPTTFGNVSKKKRAARIIDDDEELNDGRLPASYDDLPVVEDLTGVRVDEDDGNFISSRLNKAKRLKNKKVKKNLNDCVPKLLDHKT